MCLMRYNVRRSQGFALMELLISIGIMGLGLVMAIALFPAAVKENRDSVETTIGRLVSENGASIVRLALSHERMQAAGLDTSAYADCTGLLSPADREVGGRAFFVLGKLARGAGINDYQFVVVGCLLGQDQARIERLGATLAYDADGSRIEVSGGAAKLATGSPVVDDTGMYSVITGVSGNRAWTERPLNPSSGGVWVVYEVDGTGSPAKSPSPGAGVTAFRGGLR